MGPQVRDVLVRLIAPILDHPELKRAMLCAIDEGCYLFLYDTLKDAPCLCDYLQNDVASVNSQCLEDYGITEDDWTTISDVIPGCQQDWISPVRVVGRKDGNPQWEQFQRLENGKWTPMFSEQSDEGEPE